ncbi:site-specific integrase [Leucobacter allii]|uniref:Site-specific integrase n=1 Tax=Leucobacter allii TaxID=2932247 RepID=A0ABY4FQP3_9MICO|nr:site-specific integrase [Leucobacter allii]UOQ58597.1 site-specific integrase [Leucobacter allii]
MRETDAQRKAHALEDESRELGWRDPKAAARTWREWCPEWLRGFYAEDSSDSTTESLIRVHIMPKWGDVRLIDIDRHEIKAWAKEMQVEAGIAATSAKRVINAFSSSLTAAVDVGILSHNPCAKLNLGIPDNPSERTYTQKEQHRLFSELPSVLDQALVAILLGTGCRLGEALALEARHFNVQHSTVRFRQTWDSHNRKLKTYTKGKKRRTVPIDNWLLDLIKPLLKARPEGYLFRSRGGVPLDVANWRKRVWNKCSDEIGLNSAGKERGSIHTLRHTYATEQLEAGLSLAEIADLLGHSSITTTERYAHRRSKVGKKALGTIRDPRRAPKPKKRQKPRETRELPSNVIAFPGGR